MPRTSWARPSPRSSAARAPRSRCTTATRTRSPRSARWSSGSAATWSPLGGDLTRSSEADRVVHDVVARFGRLDVLVNNNAFPPTGGPTEQVSDLIWREMMARLLDEPFYCLRAALRVMRPAGRGKIINMSSAAAFPGLANYAAYTAARAGVNGLTKAVGREVAKDGIQVNAIAQNYVENPTYFPPALTARPRQARAHGQAHSRRAPGARRGIGPPRRLPRLRGRGLLHRSGRALRGRLGNTMTGTGAICFARSTQPSPRGRAAQLELPRCERPGSPQRTPTYASGCQGARASSGSQLAPVPRPM